MTPELVELIRWSADAIDSDNGDEDETTDLIAACLEERTPDEPRVLLLKLLGLVHGLVRDIEITEGLGKGVALNRWLTAKGLAAAKGSE